MTKKIRSDLLMNFGPVDGSKIRVFHCGVRERHSSSLAFHKSQDSEQTEMAYLCAIDGIQQSRVSSHQSRGPMDIRPRNCCYSPGGIHHSLGRHDIVSNWHDFCQCELRSRELV